MLFLPIVPAVYVLGALLAIIANTCFGASFVLLNAFLPVLVRNHPSIYTSSPNIETASVFSRGTSSRTSQEFRTSQELESHHPDLEDSTTALLTASHNHDPYDPTKPPLSPSNRPQKSSPELALSTRLSSQGIGIGYTAAVLVQILAVFLLVLTSSTPSPSASSSSSSEPGGCSSPSPPPSSYGHAPALPFPTFQKPQVPPLLATTSAAETTANRHQNDGAAGPGPNTSPMPGRPSSVPSCVRASSRTRCSF